MGRVFAELDDDLRAFIARQHVFFVATAPLSAEGRIHGKSLESNVPVRLALSRPEGGLNPWRVNWRPGGGRAEFVDPALTADVVAGMSTQSLVSSDLGEWCNGSTTDSGWA